jgi:hypothetical protein
MSWQSKANSPYPALLLVLAAAGPIAMVASLPWLKHQPHWLFFLLGGGAVTLTVLSSLAFAFIADRRQDEWQRSAERFSGYWGWMTGAALVTLLLAWPPFAGVIVSAVGAWTQTPNPSPKLVLLAFVAGLTTVVFAQAICMVVLKIGWTAWMSRPSREP